jgi:hypothetical protein
MLLFHKNIPRRTELVGDERTKRLRQLLALLEDASGKSQVTEHDGKAQTIGIAAARKRGVVFGRRPGQRVKADRFAPKVLKLVGEGQSYREIRHRLWLSKNTVLDIVKRARAA